MDDAIIRRIVHELNGKQQAAAAAAAAETPPGSYRIKVCCGVVRL
jgi:hypothetical protein